MLKLSRRIFKGEIILLFCAAVWGFAFIAQVEAMKTLPPFAFTALRFTLALLVIAPFVFKRGMQKFSRGEIKASLLLGALLCGGTNLQQIGLLYTTAGKAAFITGLYICFIPFFLLLIWGHKISKKALFAVALAFTGLSLLTLTDSFVPSKGDLWELACAIVFAMHVILIGKYAQEYNPFRLAFLQTLVCVFLSFVFSVIFESFSITGMGGSIPELLYAGVMSAGVAYTLQIVAQKDVPATLSSLILSLELVFAAFGGWWLLNESMSTQQLLGCLMMLMSIVCAQV